MSRHTKKRSRKAGMPPGSLVHIGETRTEEMKVVVTRYGASGVEALDLEALEKGLSADGGRITWVNVHGVHDAAMLQRLGKCFGIHPLTLEDIMNTDDITKLNRFDEYMFVEMKAFERPLPGANSGDLQMRQVSFVLGTGYLITFQEAPLDILAPIRERLNAETDWFAKMGASFLAYSIMDLIVDLYFTVIEQIDDEIFAIEEMATHEYNEDSMRDIQHLRHRVMNIRRAAWPLREVLGNLMRHEHHFIPEPVLIYFQDVYEHIIQVIETTESFREVLSNIFDIFQSSFANRLNEVMKVLTVIATIIMPMTLISGIYGMNFKYMPELSKPYGYPLALGLMGLIAGGMMMYFRKKKWF